MRIGVPTEVKADEHRVGLTPSGAEALVTAGHRVLIQAGAGRGSYLGDREYLEAGAVIVESATEVWADADLIIKVKEPQPGELPELREDQVLFAFLHLAAYPTVAKALCDAGTTSIAFETVSYPNGSLPLLAPMSEVAGRMAPQVGAHFLERPSGGRGVLMAGIPGVRPATVVVIGGGMAGSNAVGIAAGMGANVTVFDLDPDRLRAIDRRYGGSVTTVMANRADVRTAVLDADLVIGAVLVPGARAPQVLTAEDVREMRSGSVVVDIAIDQGGCFETSRETKHSDPTYQVDDVVHYAVGNIPGAVPRTSTFALANVTLPYLQSLADYGVDAAVGQRPELEAGINTRAGAITNPVVADALAR